MSQNVRKLAQNNSDIEESLLPTANEISFQSKRGVEIAEDIQDEEIARGNRLKCILALVILGLGAVAAVIIALAVK